MFHLPLLEERMILHFYNAIEPRYIGLIENERISILRDKKYMGMLKHPTNIAGIIPVHGSDANFKFDFHDALIPLAPNLTAVERCVYEMAIAGVSTIWIVCNQDIEPLIRRRVGEFLNIGNGLPTLINMDEETDTTKLFGKTVQIYYLPIKYTNFGIFDGLLWSILHAALTSYWVMRKISRWVTPDKFYVSFPHGIYNPESLIGGKLMKSLHGERKNLFLAYKGKTAIQNKLLGFCFSQNDLIEMMKAFKEVVAEYRLGADPFRKTILWREEGDKQFFTFWKVLSKLWYTLRSTDVIEVPWYYEINSWDKYRIFMGSKESGELHEFCKTYPLIRTMGEEGFKKLQKHWDNERRKQPTEQKGFDI